MDARAFGGWRRGALGVVAGCAGFFAVAAPAQATLLLQGQLEEISVDERAPVRDDRLVITSQDSGPGAVYVFDNPGGIQVSAPCVLISPTRGQCPALDRTEIGVRPGGGDNVVAPELGGATGSGYDLQRFDAYGGRGNDRFDLGGTGLPQSVLQSVAHGGPGNDVLIAGRADEVTQNGGTGRDTLVGSPGPDAMIGSDGKDNLRGNGGKDNMRGGAGPDRLAGGGARDLLFGDAGNDFLIGGGGIDLFNGGTGRDRAAPDRPGEERTAKGVEVFR